MPAWSKQSPHRLSPQFTSPSTAGNTFLKLELLRILSTVPHCGCDSAEFLTASAAINPKDPQRWADAWDHAESQTDEALGPGDAVAAGNGLLCASSYTRASGYLYMNGPILEKHHPEAFPIAQKMQKLFRCALPFLNFDYRGVEIPYPVDAGNGSPRKEVQLPGYLYIPAPAHRLPVGKISVLLNTGAAGSFQEEVY